MGGGGGGLQRGARRDAKTNSEIHPLKSSEWKIEKGGLVTKNNNNKIFGFREIGAHNL